MVQPLRVLCLRPTPPLASHEEGLADSAREHDYGESELRVGIREWFRLPVDEPLALDLGRVYPWLGKEWRDVFDLYAYGYSLADVADYWADLHGLSHAPSRRIKRQRGNRIVRRLIRRLQWLLLRDLRPL